MVFNLGSHPEFVALRNAVAGNMQATTQVAKSAEKHGTILGKHLTFFQIMEARLQVLEAHSGLSEEELKNLYDAAMQTMRDAGQDPPPFDPEDFEDPNG